MMYKVEVYENPFDLNPKVSAQTDNVLESEALIRKLTEKVLKMRESK